MHSSSLLTAPLATLLLLVTGLRTEAPTAERAPFRMEAQTVSPPLLPTKAWKPGDVARAPAMMSKPG